MDEDAPEEIDVVTSAGPLDPVIALLREYLHVTGAARALAIVREPGGDGAALVDCPRLAPIEVTVGERVVALPHTVALDVVTPAPPPGLRQLPAVEVAQDDDGHVRLTGTIGGLEHMARGVQGLAAILGPGDVAMAVFDTTTPGLPLTITAREGEPVVVTVGEDELELPEGWPPAAA